MPLESRSRAGRSSTRIHTAPVTSGTVNQILLYSRNGRIQTQAPDRFENIVNAGMTCVGIDCVGGVSIPVQTPCEVSPAAVILSAPASCFLAAKHKRHLRFVLSDKAGKSRNIVSGTGEMTHLDLSSCRQSSRPNLPARRAKRKRPRSRGARRQGRGISFVLPAEPCARLDRRALSRSSLRAGFGFVLESCRFFELRPCVIGARKPARKGGPTVAFAKPPKKIKRDP